MSKLCNQIYSSMGMFCFSLSMSPSPLFIPSLSFPSCWFCFCPQSNLLYSLSLPLSLPTYVSVCLSVCLNIYPGYLSHICNLWTATTLPGQWSLITISQYNHSFHPMFPTDHCRLLSIFRRKVRWRSEHLYIRV